MSDHSRRMSAFKVLVVADETPEFPVALHYAALRAKRSGDAVVMLRVVEPPEPAEWVSVSEEIRRQSAEAAEALTQRFAAEVWAETGLTVEIVIREGEMKDEIRRLMEEDPAIKLVVLAAGSGKAGPGPLVSSLAKGHGFGGHVIPVLVVPGGLSKDEVRAFADPASAAPAG
jgi:nucleotide-binding universal stress UspA family protein